MKTILTIAFVAFLAVTTSAVATNVHPSYTQSTTSSCFSFFQAHRQYNGAGLVWSVNQQGVTEFKIERSYDGGEFYEEVTTLPAHSAAQYRFVDSDVYPGYISYRVTAVMADGSTSLSPVVTVRIVRRK